MGLNKPKALNSRICIGKHQISGSYLSNGFIEVVDPSIAFQFWTPHIPTVKFLTECLLVIDPPKTHD
jgi:hypothetical protein